MIFPEYKTLKVTERRGGVSVCLSRPEQRNAFDATLIQELVDCFQRLASSDIRYCLLQGEGKIFCAGADLNWMKASAEYSVEENRADAEQLVTLFSTMQNLPMPLVTLVQGGCYGGGLGLLAVSDYVVAEKSARFCFGETRIGLVPAVISAFLIPKISLSHILPLMLTASPFDAEHALQIGLVQAIAKDRDDLDRKGNAWIEELLKCSPQAVRATKALLKTQFAQQDKQTIAACVKAIAEIRVTKEAQEGLAAFLEKKGPSWRK